MKRKIIKLGSSTLVVSLPSKWTKEYDLVQGDELEVDERNKELILSTEKFSPESRKTIDISELDTKLVERFLLGAYIQGYDEIKLIFNRPEIIDLKTKKKILTINYIQSIVNSLLISMEIIDQKEDSCILKDLSHISDTAFEPVLRRVFLLLKQMSANTLGYAREFDKEKMKHITPARFCIRRFINYTLRILNKKGTVDMKKVPQYYSMISELKHIGDVLQYISVEFEKRKNKPSKELIAAFEETDKSLQLFYEMFYKFDQAKALEIIKRRRNFFELVNSVQYAPKASMEDVLLSSRLSVMMVQLLNLSEMRISLEM